MRTGLITAILVSGIATAAWADQPRLPPAPKPTKELVKIGVSPKTEAAPALNQDLYCPVPPSPSAQETRDMKASCDKLEAAFFNTMKAVEDDDAADLERCVESGAEVIWCRKILGIDPLGPADQVMSTEEGKIE